MTEAMIVKMVVILFSIVLCVMYIHAYRKSNLVDDIVFAVLWYVVLTGTLVRLVLDIKF